MLTANGMAGAMTPRGLTIVGLGDSTTAGTPAFRSPLEVPPDGEGDPESQYSFWMVRAHPEWTVLNRGINGQRAAEIRARFDRDVLAVHPQYAILLAGVNDIHGGDHAEAVERHLAAMYADALDAGIVPVAATVLPYTNPTTRGSGGILTLDRGIESVAEGLGIPFCDTHAAVAGPAHLNRLPGCPHGRHPGGPRHPARGRARR